MEKHNHFENNNPNISIKQDYLQTIRNHIYQYLGTHDITLQQLSEKADIPYSTLNSILYGHSKDCNLSTAISLALAMETCLDELSDAHTMPNSIASIVHSYMSLPKRSRNIVKYTIKHQHQLIEQADYSDDTINVMYPITDIQGNILESDNYEPLTLHEYGIIGKLSTSIDIGIFIPNERFAPIYMPGDILLLSDVKKSRIGTHIVVSMNGNIRVLEKAYKGNYLSLKNKRDVTIDIDNDILLGYIVSVIQKED